MPNHDDTLELDRRSTAGEPGSSAGDGPRRQVLRGGLTGASFRPQTRFSARSGAPVSDPVARPARHLSLDHQATIVTTSPRRWSKRQAAIGAGGLLAGLGALAFVAISDRDGARDSASAPLEQIATPGGALVPGGGQVEGDPSPAELAELAALGQEILPPGFEPLPPELPVPADYREGLPSPPAAAAAQDAAAAPASAEAAEGAPPPDAAPSAQAAAAATEAATAAAAPPASAAQIDTQAAPPSESVRTVAADSTPAPAGPAERPGASALTPARWTSGGLTDADNPRGRFQGTVNVRFTVEPNGRVTGCRSLGGSGNGKLAARTCTLAEQRLRFSPALDAQGQPIATEIRTSYTWGRKPRR